jgi:hypothetical protein
MISIVKFRAEHLLAIKLQEAQAFLSEWVTQEQGEALEKLESRTALLGDVPIAVAGVIPLDTGMGRLWSFIADTGPMNFLQIHRATKQFLAKLDFRRLEIIVDIDHIEAHRWAQMLGFHMEAARLQSYTVDNRDCSLYARVQ